MRTDKKFRKIVAWGWVSIGFIMMFGIMYACETEVLTFEALQESVCGLTATLVFGMAGFVGIAYERGLYFADRKKNGLRGNWKNEDMDELEERVRKLEEKE